MKQIIFPLILILLVACQRDEALPEATSAAKEVYLQYADRKDLTVALIGDYQGYNAVMLQAQTTEDWLRLCEEFGACGCRSIGHIKSVRSHDSQFQYRNLQQLGGF